ncbi:Structural maintenance of chromosomes protein 6 [Knufia obscura]|uniref:Structural maintenance of chromosomes protein 6 n=2 Tax=Knufia TaxID=430999 RepID=A0AAN8ESH3_9EURO|nr:Structural maintenance of chromosomes protein 6 [Knufia obscura]KAK5957893.1 Structural maintenance of chromosomes protein 6 [Knufia fluminis]
MSHRKRLADHDLDDSDVSNISSSPPGSSSQIGSDGRKRRRISDQSDTTPEQIQQDDTQMTGQIDSDDGDVADSDDSAELAATQAILERRARQRDQGNEPKEAGVLDKVELFDFMCHHYFEYKLGPLINFICGKNGSGKSAILTAIILCLGGKASATNRGASLKRFIREGAERARIVCRIRNKGNMAYLPDEFGDHITIERHFSKASTSGYKICTASGRQYSTKKSDLEAITDHFNLQIDNPLNVLSQDAARSFIGDSNPTMKYRFFLKGVQLEQLNMDYQVIAERLQSMAFKLERTKDDVKSLESVKEQKRQDKETAERTEGIRDRMREISRQVAWVQIKEQEDIVEGYAADIADSEGKIQEVQAVLNETDTKLQEAETAKESTRTEMDEAGEALRQFGDEQKSVQSELDDAKKDMANAQAEVRDVGAAVKNHSQLIGRQEKAIADEEQRLLEANGGGAARRLLELEAAKSNARQVREDWNGHRAGRQEIEQNIKNAKVRVAENLVERDRCQQNVDSQRDKIREMEANRDNQSTGFRRNTDRLEQAIERESRWQRKPIGPVGKHVKLLRPEWSSILERTFGNTLGGFVAFSKQDMDLLKKLGRQVGCDAEVTVINDLPIVPREPDEQFDTILRVLDIPNDHIKKHLIIQHAIEQFILVPDVSQATAIMYNSDRLRCVRGCFAFNPHDKQKGVLLKYGASGHPSQDPVHAWGTMPRMRGDMEANIAARRQGLHDAQDELAAAKAAWQDARANQIKLEQSLKRHDGRERELKIASQQADDEVEALENAIKEDNVESGKLEALRGGLEEAKEAKGLAEEQFKDAINAQDIAKGELQARQRRLADANAKIDELRRTYEGAQAAHKAADRAHSTLLLDKNEQFARVADARSDQERVMERKARAEETLREWTDKARERSERVNVPEGVTSEQLTDRYQRLKVDYERQQRRQGFTVEEAAAAAVTAARAHKQAKKDYDELKEGEVMLTESLKNRRRLWQIFRQHITARARTNFSKLLAERGFRGKLLVNHSKHLLDLSVEPDITRRSDQGRSAKTLSGGEKSFSQICLLLALWDAMGSPIRCLDEFDVFMDAVNRSLSVRMIIEAARESIGRQYILISPGSKSDIPKATDVAVSELSPPERGEQRTIEETRGGGGRRG